MSAIDTNPNVGSMPRTLDCKAAIAADREFLNIGNSQFKANKNTAPPGILRAGARLVAGFFSGKIGLNINSVFAGMKSMPDRVATGLGLAGQRSMEPANVVPETDPEIEWMDPDVMHPKMLTTIEDFHINAPVGFKTFMPPEAGPSIVQGDEESITVGQDESLGVSDTTETEIAGAVFRAAAALDAPFDNLVQQIENIDILQNVFGDDSDKLDLALREQIEATPALMGQLDRIAQQGVTFEINTYTRGESDHADVHRFPGIDVVQFTEKSIKDGTFLSNLKRVAMTYPTAAANG